MPRGGASTSTPARSPRPNGSSRRASSGPARSPATSAVRTSPASRRSVSSTTRRRISSSATIVTAWCRVSRSSSFSGPASLAAISHASGSGPSPLPACGRTTGNASPAAGKPSAPGTNPRRPPARVRSRNSDPSAASAGGASAARPSRRASSAPRASKISAGPPIIEASAPATPSRPRSDSTIRSSRSWAESARRSTAYCSFTSRVNAFSVMAMNGSSYGTSKSAKPCSSAAARSASGACSCEKPMPTPSPLSPWRTSRARYSRCCASSPSCRPVVSSSSPPDSHGVGSSSSEMCTQRTARSSPASPATTSRSSSRSRSRNGNIECRAYRRADLTRARATRSPCV